MTHDKSLGSKEKILKSGMELYIKMVKLRLRLFKQSHQVKKIMCSRRVSGTWKTWIYISIIYILDEKYWNPNEVNVDEIFAYSATLNMIVENEDH